MGSLRKHPSCALVKLSGHGEKKKKGWDQLFLLLLSLLWIPL